MIELREVCGCLETGRRHPVASLDSVNLGVERGEWVWLVGPTESGKSSLLRLLSAQSRAARGQVLLHNRDLTTLGARDVARLRRGLGIVPTDLALVDEHRARHHVEWALRATGMSPQGVARWAPLALERAGLSERAEVLARDLSLVERVQLALARAFAGEPALLLVDDPTRGLEPEDVLIIGRLLQKFHLEHGPTIVMATGARALVDAFKHRVVRLRAGRVWSDENPGSFGSDDLFAVANRKWVAERTKAAGAK